MENQRVAEYKPGELLHIIAGPLAGQMATFIRMIERADETFPEIEASLTLMGREVKTRVDPIHARPVT
jgi:transcription antitermination factor NusG